MRDEHAAEPVEKTALPPKTTIKIRLLDMMETAIDSKSVGN